MSKVDQKRNWVKWKSVQTLLRIPCLVDDKKSYVVIICANSCENLTNSEMYQAEVGSNIAQNRLFGPYEDVCGHYMCQICQKLTKREIGSSLSRFEHCSERLFS